VGRGSMKNFLSSKVSIIKSGDDLKSDLNDCLIRLGGIRNFIKPGDQVFIKPNLTAGASPESGGTTDVKFVEEIINIIKEIKKVKIIIGEGAGCEINTDEAFDKLGYKEMARRKGIDLVNCDNTEYVKVVLDDYLYKPEYSLPKIFMESDVFISVPVLKNHAYTGITVSLKNSFGLIPDEEKNTAHRDSAIEECLVDISKIKPADLVIVDGRIGSEGIAGGVDFLHPRKVGLLLAGNDMVAVDAVAARLIKQNPRIRHLFWAQQQGIGVCDPNYIDLCGSKINDDIGVKFLSPREQINQEIDNIYVYDLNSCTGCRGVVDAILCRYGKNSFLENVNIFYGPGDFLNQTKNVKHNLFVGNCVKKEYKENNISLPGCPPDSNKLMDKLKSLKVLCSKCDTKAKELLSIINGNKSYLKFKPYLRILAGGKEIFRGEKVSGKMNDLIITIGDCQKNYIRNHRNRIKKALNVNPDNYCRHVKGCPPESDFVKQCFEEFYTKHMSEFNIKKEFEKR